MGAPPRVARAFLLAAAALLACSRPRPEAPARPARPEPPAVVSWTTRYRYAGLVWNRAVTLLPVGARRRVSGDPGRGYLLGTIRDGATWQAFAAASELRGLPEVDFAREMVVFAVLDSRTSALSPVVWKVDSAGGAVFSFAVGGAEPDNPDAAPTTLAVVDRTGVRSIAFRTLDGASLGSIRP